MTSTVDLIFLRHCPSVSNNGDLCSQIHTKHMQFSAKIRLEIELQICTEATKKGISPLYIILMKHLNSDSFSQYFRSFRTEILYSSVYISHIHTLAITIKRNRIL